MKETETAWFRPLWRRLVVTGVPAAWLGFEVIFSHESMWITITGALLAYCVWTFFITFPKASPPSVPPSDPPATPQ